MPPRELPAPPWPADAEFPRYGDAEYAARWARLRSVLVEAGAGVALVAGHGAGRAEIEHLVNAPVRWESVLVFPADPSVEPRLLVQLDNHAAGTRPWSIVPVEVTGMALGERAAEDATALAGSGRIALLGPISDRLADVIRRHAVGRELRSITGAFNRQRMVKSEEELAWTRYGASICDRSIDVFLETATPGMREDELGAILAGAVVAAGGQLGICFLATSSMELGGSPSPRQTWSRRSTSSGDLAVFELSAGFGGATGQVLRTVSLGREPSAQVRRLHDVAEAVYGDVFRAIRPGLAVAELEAIGGAAIEGAGLTIVDDLVHGYGGGYLPPHVRTPGTRREDPGDAVLQAGQLLVIQPNVTTLDHRFGVQTGELVVVTDGGAVALHHAPQGLLRVASA